MVGGLEAVFGVGQAEGDVLAVEAGGKGIEALGLAAEAAGDGGVEA